MPVNEKILGPISEMDREKFSWSFYANGERIDGPITIKPTAQRITTSPANQNTTGSYIGVGIASDNE